MAKPITIIGFMGSGKSTMGKMLASKWKCNFIDLDHTIEKQYQLSIPRIFDLYHETGFRKIEAEILRKVLDTKEACVISLGGGTPCFEENMEVILEKSHSVYLKVSPKELVKRLSRSHNPRPLVVGKTQEELLAYVRETLEKREPYYLRAQQVIESDCIRAGDLLTFIHRPDQVP